MMMTETRTVTAVAMVAKSDGLNLDPLLIALLRKFENAGSRKGLACRPTRPLVSNVRYERFANL
jgi:hypothetical protein